MARCRGSWDAGRAGDLGLIGYAVVVVFACTWPVAIAVRRLGRIEERWAAPLEGG